MELPDDFTPFNIVEVRFKGSRKEFFRNTNRLDLYTGDYVAVESSVGFDIGTVSATGEIVRLQLKKYRVQEDSERILPILRKATDKDLEKNEEVKQKENSTLERARTIAFRLNLQMKISDIEIQGDGRKVIFFYTAEQRVDFRELIRLYADEFRMKIEMRHISYREEASRLGGIGVCGRQLCCSTWLTDYKMVTTGAARVQNLSINMEKLAGQCGRLKCCLNYELDLYVEALDKFPKAKMVKLETATGMAYSRKTDILKQLMWFSYEDNQTWIALEVEKVKEYLEENKQGKTIPPLQDIAAASQVMEQAASQAPEFIGGAELLEDRELEAEIRKNRQDKGRHQHPHNKGGQRQPHNQGGNPHGKPHHRGPDNRGPRRDNRGPRPPHQNSGPKPNNPPKS
jgi:cell fate regulator YaaT (PSP1 superfamily)